LGPATDAPGMLADLISAGVNVVRMNFSHGTAEQHAARVAAVRTAAEMQCREVGILADLQGPKIRIEKFAAGKVALKAGDSFDLICRADAAPGDAAGVGVSYLGLVNDVHAGDMLLLDDGLMVLKVLRVAGDTIHTEVLTDGALSDRKGLNRLGGGLSLGALTEQVEVKAGTELVQTSSNSVTSTLSVEHLNNLPLRDFTQNQVWIAVVQLATEQPVVNLKVSSSGSVTMLFWSRLVIHTFRFMPRACRLSIIALGFGNPVAAVSKSMLPQPTSAPVPVPTGRSMNMPPEGIWNAWSWSASFSTSACAFATPLAARSW